MSDIAEWIAADGTHLLLDGSQGVKINRGVTGLDGPPLTNTLDQRVAGDGAVRVYHRRPERSILLPIQLDESVISRAEVVALFQGPGQLVATSGRILNDVVYESGLEGRWSIETGGVDGLSHRKYPLTLLALDPHWLGTFTGVNGVFASATPWNAAISWNAPIPWNGGSSFGLNVEGDVATYPAFIIGGPATDVTMAVGDQAWQTARPLLLGEYMTIETFPGKRGPHLGASGFVPGVVDGPVDWSLLTEDSRLFTLPPGPSSLILGASGTSGETNWLVAWNPRFLTP